MEDDEKAVQELQGRVKLFDPVKGFGFILSDETGSDVLLHANPRCKSGQTLAILQTR